MARKRTAKHAVLIVIGFATLAYGSYKVLILPVLFDGKVEFTVWNLYLHDQEALVVGVASIVLSIVLILLGAVGDEAE